MKPLNLLLCLLLCLASATAMAQRRVLPVVDLVNVPVSLATKKTLTADQVRAAIVSAALAAEWDVDPQPDGSLRLNVLKDMEYSVAVRATFTPTTYSLAYLGSENLKTTDPGIFTPDRPGQETLSSYATNWRATRGAKQPEAPYAVDRAGAFIHPTYEQLVYELSAGVRRHLHLVP
ncbi:MAG TPA: hypothetical protein VN201_01570 [Roseateles sp.]|nr:hypothetical protein [Roseateles sp.]